VANIGISCTWWIDEPRLMASSNPSTRQLTRLRSQGFGLIVSLLEENKQPPRYDKAAIARAGWSMHSIPIEEGGVPSIDQMLEFTARMRSLPEQTKVLVHCESGLGRSAFMGAVHWIAKGLTTSRAIAHVRRAGVTADWVSGDRKEALQRYESLRRQRERQ
jgi:protein-tyrosine phosphatase